MSLTKADIEARYDPDLLSVVASVSDGGLNEDAINKALSDALDLAYSYIAARYPTPLAPLPEVLKRACVDMAVYWLAENGGELTEERRQRHKDAVNWLKAISQGYVSLRISPSDGESSALRAEAFVPNARQFSRDELRLL